MEALLIISSLIFSAIFTLVLASYVAVKVRKPGFLSYALLMISVSFYSFGYAIELSSSTVGGIFNALKIQYIGISFLPVFWVIFAADYTGLGKKILRSLYPVFFIISFTTLILVFTNEYHHIYFKNIGVIETKLFSISVLDRGPWYWLNVTYAYSLLLAGNVLFLILVARSSGYLRKQAILMFFSSVIPWAANILYLIGASIYGIDHTPFFLTLVGPIFILALFRFKMFDLVPIALRTVFDEMNDPIFVLDTGNRLVDYNKAAIDLLGNRSKLMVGLSIDQIFYNHAELIDLLKNNVSNADPIISSATGATQYYRVGISKLIASEKRIGSVLTLHDVTSEQMLIGRLHTMATIDELTGINNRRNFMVLCGKELDRVKRSQRPLALLMMDIDFFKRINDEHGHQAGDIVLQNVAKFLSDDLRSTDILGRYGGEEFVAALPETDRQTASSIAARLNRGIESLEIRYQDKTITVTISIGIVVADAWDQDISLDRCLAKADEALYRAKEEGRNRFVECKLEPEFS